MKEVLDDLKSVPGILGACLYHGRKGPLCSNFPSIFKADKLAQIGKLLMKIQSAGQMNFDDLTDLSLHYDESVILVREVEENLLVFTLCDPGFNSNLVSMSLNLLQQELKNKQAPLVKPARDEGAEESGDDVAPVLEGLKSLLPKILGPMAGMIFDEVVEAWRHRGGRGIGSLEELLQLLREEIGDVEKIRSYEKLIAPILQQARKGD